MNEPEPILGSLTRITDFDTRPPEPIPVPRGEWSRGDYVIVEMLEEGPASYEVESADG